MAFDTRHRDKSGEISRKHGNTLIRTLRKTYGQSFAGSCGNKKKLETCFINWTSHPLPALSMITRRGISTQSAARG
jgi:hypothetical protein